MIPFTKSLLIKLDQNSFTLFCKVLIRPSMLSAFTSLAFSKAPSELTASLYNFFCSFIDSINDINIALCLLPANISDVYCLSTSVNPSHFPATSSSTWSRLFNFPLLLSKSIPNLSNAFEALDKSSSFTPKSSATDFCCITLALIILYAFANSEPLLPVCSINAPIVAT